MAKHTKQAVVPPKNIGEPKSIKEERERIEATRLASTVKIKMPDGSYEQVDKVTVSGAKVEETDNG